MVEIDRRRQIQQRLQHAMDIGRSKEILTAHDMANPIPRIVQRHRQMIGNRRVLRDMMTSPSFRQSTCWPCRSSTQSAARSWPGALHVKRQLCGSLRARSAAIGGRDDGRCRHRSDHPVPRSASRLPAARACCAGAETAVEQIHRLQSLSAEHSCPSGPTGKSPPRPSQPEPAQVSQYRLDKFRAAAPASISSIRSRNRPPRSRAKSCATIAA